jgi:hypothetical protein
MSAKVLPFRAKKAPEPTPKTSPSTFEEQVECIAIKTIESLFSSEQFQQAFTKIIEEHDATELRRSALRTEIGKLVEKVAKIQNVETQEVYTHLLRQFKIPQGQANLEQLTERRDYLTGMLALLKAEKSQKKKGKK